MPEPNEIPSAERLPYVKGLIFLARAGGHTGEEERARLTEAIARCGLAPADAAAARAALDEPLDLEAVCAPLRGSPTRYALYLDAVGLALADGVLAPEEDEALEALRERLGLQGYEAEALRQVAESLRALKATTADPAAVARTREALARLAAVGIPVGAAALSGTVQGLSAAALASGLAALGLGLGVTGGIGVCVLLGFASYKGVKWLLRKAEARSSRSRTPSEPRPARKRRTMTTGDKSRKPARTDR
jgi:hypothetical protein